MKTSKEMRNQNRFAVLSKEKEFHRVSPEYKPPPIYIREQNSNELVQNLIKMIGDRNFHMITLKKGNIHETKVQVYNENNYRRVVKS